MTWTYIENPTGTLEKLVSKLQDHTCTICVIVGPIGCGKSTLIANAFQMCPCIVRQWSIDQSIDHLKPAHGSVATYFAQVRQPTVIMVEDVDVAMANSRGLHLQLAQLVKALRASCKTGNNTKYLLTASSTASASDVKSFKAFMSAAIQAHDVLHISHPTPEIIDTHLRSRCNMFMLSEESTRQFLQDRRYNLKIIHYDLLSICRQQRQKQHVHVFTSYEAQLQEKHQQEKHVMSAAYRKKTICRIFAAQCCAALLMDSGEDKMADGILGVIADCNTLSHEHLKM